MTEASSPKVNFVSRWKSQLWTHFCRGQKDPKKELKQGRVIWNIEIHAPSYIRSLL
uniref:Uncharacterized protein n=1 Tax=Lepeophtheirus salmonis TaxID=72036 RepID=A0A0K2VGS4_LEPSM